MNRLAEMIHTKPWLGWVLFGGIMGTVFVAGLFVTTIMERRSESKKVLERKVAIGPWESNNAKWGINFPREYQTWLDTQDTSFKSKYNGGAARDMLKENPRLVVLWAGYGFSKDYNQGRGHYYAVSDVHHTLRTGDTTAGTCWTCKSPDVPRMMHKKGVTEFYADKWMNLGPEIDHAIGCLDCHDPDTMNLHISRPALKEAFANQGKDITKATHQEMRSLVCAQCHVEYYFKGKDKYLTFPWHEGMTMEAMEAYFDNVEHVDWKHKLSQAPMLKTQHPDFELFQTGIHAQRGLACADCHMPYRSEGGVKFSNHKVQSPLNNISNTCQVCHRESEDELRQNVYDRQDKIKEMRDRVEELLVYNHVAAKKVWELGATKQEMKNILVLIRHAQWRWDFIAASHGAAFHTPVESARVLSASLQKANDAKLELTKLLMRKGFDQEIVLPDISSKEKAQAYIGLDMKKIKAGKQKFLETTLPKWKETN